MQHADSAIERRIFLEQHALLQNGNARLIRNDLPRLLVHRAGRKPCGKHSFLLPCAELTQLLLRHIADLDKLLALGRKRRQVRLTQRNHAMHALIALQINVAGDDVRIEARAEPAGAQPHRRRFQNERFTHEAFDLHRRTALGNDDRINVRTLNLVLQSRAFEHANLHALPAQLAAGFAQLIELFLIRRTGVLAHRAALVQCVNPTFLNIEFKHL